MNDLELLHKCHQEKVALTALLEEANSKLTVALALTDTGSTEFRNAFPPKSSGEALYPRAVVPGWRVVEKIRELLLTANLSMMKR